MDALVVVEQFVAAVKTLRAYAVECYVLTAPYCNSLEHWHATVMRGGKLREWGYCGGEWVEMG